MTMQINTSLSASTSSYLGANRPASVAEVAAERFQAVKARVDTVVDRFSASSPGVATLSARPPVNLPAPAAKATAANVLPAPDRSAIQNDGVTPAADPADPAEALSATAPPPRTFTADDLEKFMESFGLSKGTEGYSEEFDFNGDGSIDGADLSVLLANFKRRG